MGFPMDLEALRAVFADPRVWVACGTIQKVEIAPDRSTIRVLIKEMLDNDEIVSRVSWPQNVYSAPEVGDLVLFVLSDADEDNSFVIAKLSGFDDKIPLRATLGQDVVNSRDGRKLNVSSDTRLNLGRGGLIEENEAVVLGNILKDALNAFTSNLLQGLTDVKDGPIGIGNLGFTIATHPTLVAKIALVEAQNALDVAEFLTLATTNILSQISFTER